MVDAIIRLAAFILLDLPALWQGRGQQLPCSTVDFKSNQSICKEHVPYNCIFVEIFVLIEQKFLESYAKLASLTCMG